MLGHPSNLGIGERLRRSVILRRRLFERRPEQLAFARQEMKYVLGELPSRLGVTRVVHAGYFAIAGDLLCTLKDLLLPVWMQVHQREGHQVNLGRMAARISWKPRRWNRRSQVGGQSDRPGSVETVLEKCTDRAGQIHRGIQQLRGPRVGARVDVEKLVPVSD